MLITALQAVARKMHLPQLTTLAVAANLLTVQAQDVLRRQVVSTFIYTTYGDRTPMAWSQEPVLTPLGAQQLYEAGVNFRQRYITTQSETVEPQLTRLPSSRSTDTIPHMMHFETRRSLF